MRAFCSDLNIEELFDFGRAQNYYNCELVERFSRFHTQLFLNSNPRERTARERAANT